MERLDADYENIRSILEWCTDGAGDCDTGLKLASNMFWYWNLRGRLREGYDWTRRLYEKAQTRSSAIRAKALYTIGGLAFLQGDYTEAKEKLDECIGIYRNLEENENYDKINLAYALVILGVLKLNYGPDLLEEARRDLIESVEIFRALNDSWGLALAQNDLARIDIAEGRYDEGFELYKKSLQLWNEMEDDWGSPLTLVCLGEAIILQGIPSNNEKALDYLQQALKLQRDEDKWGKAMVYKLLGKAFFALSRFNEAAENLCKSLLMHHELNRQQLIAECLEEVAALAHQGRMYYEGILLDFAAKRIRIEIHALQRVPVRIGQSDYRMRTVESVGVSEKEIARAEEESKNLKTVIYIAVQLCNSVSQGKMKVEE